MINSKVFLVIFFVIGGLSLCPWLMWLGMLFIGPDEFVSLLVFAWGFALTYPFTVGASLIYSLVKLRQGQGVPVLVVIAPLIHAALTFFAGVVAFYQVTH